MPIRVLKRGSKGPFVAEVQKSLNQIAGYDLNYYSGNGSSLLPPLEVDGKYGKKTADRVREFQQWTPPLKVDGKIGPNTYAKITGKYWTPEEDKKAGAAAPIAPAAAPRSEGHLYVLQAKEFRSQKQSGKHPRRTSHDPKMCHYHYVETIKGLPEALGDIVDEENIRVKDMILCGHGAGGGSIFFGNEGAQINFHFEGNLKFFDGVKGKFASGAIIWVYACSFATYKFQDNNSFDHDLVQPAEMFHDLFFEGQGFKAMRNIANYTGCEVRAGLDSQTANFDGFRAAWTKVRPRATRPEIYYDGRLMQSLGGFDTHVTEQIRGSLVKMYNFLM